MASTTDTDDLPLGTPPAFARMHRNIRRVCYVLLFALVIEGALTFPLLAIWYGFPDLSPKEVCSELQKVAYSDDDRECETHSFPQPPLARADRGRGPDHLRGHLGRPAQARLRQRRVPRARREQGAARSRCRHGPVVAEHDAGPEGPRRRRHRCRERHRPRHRPRARRPRVRPGPGRRRRRWPGGDEAGRRGARSQGDDARGRRVGLRTAWPSSPTRCASPSRHLQHPRQQRRRPQRGPLRRRDAWRTSAGSSASTSSASSTAAITSCRCSATPTRPTSSTSRAWPPSPASRRTRPTR